jgi:predicted amidohydrolase
MATIKASPFKLALVQLGQVGKDKTRNLAHAREMVLKAAKGAEGKGKVDVVVLPVSCEPMCHELAREEGDCSVAGRASA